MNNSVLEPVPVSVTKHTPGPWTVRSDGEANCFTIADSRSNWLLYVLHNGEQHTPTQDANARLIASAPALLEALSEVVELLSSHPDVNVGNSKIHYCFHAARTAIFSAQGEA